MRPLRRTVVAATVATLLLAACGSSTTPLEGVAPPAPAPAPAGTVPAPDPVPAPEPEPEPEPGPEPAPAPAATPTGGTLLAHVLDVGQGSALLLQHPEVTVLVDTGRHDRSDVVPALRARGVSSLDLLVVTHPHADHVGQFDAVMAAFPVAEVWWSGSVATSATFGRAVAALEASSARYEEPRAPATTTVGPLTVDVVSPWPGADLRDLNDASLALRFSYGGFALVVTGDAESGAERRMAAQAPDLLAADLLVVGHHGSRTSSIPSFLDAVAPTVAVWSAGAGNSYGHPHAEVIAALTGRGITVLGTATHGTVTVATDGATVEIRSER